MSARTEWLAVLSTLTLALAPAAIRGEETAAEPSAEAPSAEQRQIENPILRDPVEEAPPSERPAGELSNEPIVVPKPEAGANAQLHQPAPGDTGPLLHGTLELSLEDAIKMGLENNLDVQVERFGPMIAEFDEKAAWGAYDPEAYAQMFYRDQRDPSANVLLTTSSQASEDFISNSRSTDGLGGFRGILPVLGTQYNAHFSGSRETFNSGIQTLSPEYNSGWGIDVTQPVLRDLFWNAPWTQVRTSRLLLGASQEGFRSSVMDVVQRIEDAYWGLIAADEAQRVANKSLETASALLDQTKTQFEVGVVSKVEVTEAEAGVSQRAVEQIRAVNQYRNQQDVLIDLVLGPNLRAASTLEVRPTDRPDDFTPYEIDVEGAVSRAFEHRPELVQADQEIERSEVQAQFARNQMLPALDGVFSFRQSGLSGSQSHDFNPCTFSRDPNCANINVNQGPWRRTLDDYPDTPSYIAGAQFSIPFPNRTARANASKSEIEVTRAHTQKARLEQQIILDVRQAARNLKASQEGIVAAQEARRAAAEQLRAEEIRLQYGESTPFDVLQREEQLASSERVEIEAFQAYRRSVSALDRAQGTILRNRNIDIAPTAAVR
jgi:outer membrane protein